MITSALLFQLLQRVCLLRSDVHCDTGTAALYILIMSPNKLASSECGKQNKLMYIIFKDC